MQGRHTIVVLLLLALTLPACGSGIIEQEEREVPAFLYSFAPVPGVDISHWSGDITDAQVSCWWDLGIRHVIAGTQNPARTVHQLDKLVQGGMSVDAYVWMYWDQDPAQQVQAALGIVQDFPLGRLWLDVEDDPGSLTTGQIEAKIQAALDACGGFSCGIYTRKSWWDAHMSDSGEGSTVFAHLPLWYANYDSNPSLNTWSYQKFGGWDAPTGKQYTNTIHLCGVPVDRDTIYASYTPGGAGTPVAPVGLEPDEGETLTDLPIQLVCDPVTGAVGYEFGIERLENGVYQHVDSILSEAPAASFVAPDQDATYRWRVRATNDVGWGRWSAWAAFNVLLPTDLEPVEAPEGLSPDNGEAVPVARQVAAPVSISLPDITADAGAEVTCGVTLDSALPVVFAQVAVEYNSTHLEFLGADPGADAQAAGLTQILVNEDPPFPPTTDPQLDDRDGDAKKLIQGGQDKMLKGGTISLQSESHPVQFRKVELLKLEP